MHPTSLSIYRTNKTQFVAQSILVVVMLVQYCRTDTTREWLDTTRTTRTTRTGHEKMVYGSYRSRKYPVEQTMVTCISLVRQHFNQDSTTRTTRTGRETMVHESYRSRKYPVEQTMVTCISLVRQHFNQDSTTRTTRTTRTGRETMVHESYNMVNCIDIYIPMINNSVELIRPVNGSRNKHAKDNACPKGQNTMNIPRSQSVRKE